MQETAPSPSPLTFDDSAYFAEFTINGHAFSVDLSQASDRLAEIDRQHRNDHYRCVSCQADWLPAKGEPAACPTCSATGADVFAPQEYLDDVAAMLIEKYGVSRCGRKAAAGFYNAIFDALDSLKKNTSPPPASPISTEA